MRWMHNSYGMVVDIGYLAPEGLRRVGPWFSTWGIS
jgi:hypothetical protein